MEDMCFLMLLCTLSVSPRCVSLVPVVAAGMANVRVTRIHLMPEIIAVPLFTDQVAKIRKGDLWWYKPPTAPARDNSPSLPLPCCQAFSQDHSCEFSGCLFVSAMPQSQ